ncbi:hypothetical protein BXZ70DRAFT_1012979 [Cristinia sonorae]|uniref:Uncharacterized protein n=1 Tax=Cristinia sonorae TaxID=1940300 RepID=A0A8K0UED5_9AGAR|nr:hypothetical protein BXZ70DRAFT_1012979 [Cristinia sonorae]
MFVHLPRHSSLTPAHHDVRPFPQTRRFGPYSPKKNASSLRAFLSDAVVALADKDVPSDIRNLLDGLQKELSGDSPLTPDNTPPNNAIPAEEPSVTDGSPDGSGHTQGTYSQEYLITVSVSLPILQELDSCSLALGKRKLSFHEPTSSQPRIGPEDLRRGYMKKFLPCKLSNLIPASREETEAQVSLTGEKLQPIYCGGDVEKNDMYFSRFEDQSIALVARDVPAWLEGMALGAVATPSLEHARSLRYDGERVLCCRNFDAERFGVVSSTHAHRNSQDLTICIVVAFGEF